MPAYDKNCYCYNHHIAVVNSWLYCRSLFTTDMDKPLIKSSSQCTFARFSPLICISIYTDYHWRLLNITDKSISHNNRRVRSVLCFELWLDQRWYEIFICGLLQGRHAVKKALIWQAKQTLMRPDNQWRHWWQRVVALGSERLGGLTVNNEWGDSGLISEVVSLPDTQLAFQWGLQHRRQHANKHPNTSCLAGLLAASLLPNKIKDKMWINTVHSWRGGKKVFFEHINVRTVSNFIQILSVNCGKQGKHGLHVGLGQVRKHWGPSVSLSLTR